MASPWLLSDCAGSGHPIHIGPRLSNWLDRLDPCDMAGCQGRVAHHYWAMITNITAIRSTSDTTSGTVVNISPPLLLIGQKQPRLYHPSQTLN